MKKTLIILSFFSAFVFSMGIFLAPTVGATDNSQFIEAVGSNTDTGGDMAGLYDYTTCYYPTPSCPTKPVTVTTFQACEVGALWIHLSNVVAGDQIYIRWTAPNGRYWTWTYNIPSSWSSYCFTGYWGDGIPDIQGQWQIYMNYNGMRYINTYAYVSGSACIWPATYKKMLLHPNEIDTLRSFRDTVLKDNEITSDLVARLYERSAEVALILLTEGDLSKAGNLLTKLLPEIENVLAGGQGNLTLIEIARINSFLNNLAVEGSTELKSLIADTKAILDDADMMAKIGFDIP